MGIKLKRKAVKNVSDDSGAEDSVESSLSAPPSKKHKVLAAEDFIQELRGPNNTEAVKQWLYLISNKKEKEWLDRAIADQNRDRFDNSEEEQSDEDDSSKTNNDREMENEGENTSENVEEREDSGTDDSGKDVGAEHIDAFICSGGSLADIIFTLPSPDNLNRNLSYVKQVFQALFKVLVRISAHHHDKIPEAVEVCRQFMTMYSSCINHMLKNRTAPIVNWKLLTAMVSLDSKFAKEILNLISLEAELVDNLTSLAVSVSARVAYLNFLIALLIDADSSLTMAITLKPWLLTRVMDGLQYDPSNVVILLLLTIKKQIVENMSVPKTSKQKIFNSDVIISLLHLYKWKGTQNRPQTKSLSAWAMRKINQPKLMKEIDSFEVEQVASTVHELLLVLLTSYRYGVIFKDTHQSDRHNLLVSKVLKRVGHPWENPKVADLISKILAACPDLLWSTVQSVEPFIQPRSSSKWFNCVNFLKQVLDDQNTEEILKHQLPMNMQQLKTAAVNICMPKPIVRALCSNNSNALCNEDIAVAKCTVDLFVHMLRKIYNFVGVVRRWAFEKVIAYAQSTAFCTRIRDDLLTQIPSLDAIQKSWQLWSDKHIEANSQQSDGKSEKPIDILSLLLELLEMYAELCLPALRPFLSDQSDLKACMMKFVVKDLDSEHIAGLRNRLFQLLLTINDEHFSAGNIEIRDSMSIIFCDLISSQPTVRSMASSVLQALIRQAGSLEGSSQEAVVWLSIFQETYTYKKESSAEAVSILVESMIRACTSCPKYLDIIARSEEEAAKTSDEFGASSSSLSDGTAWQELFDELAENHEIQLPSADLIKTAKLSPWLPAFLEVLREDMSNKKLKRQPKQAVEEFCCKLILRLLCRFPHSGAFLHLTLTTYSNVIPSKLADYLRSWLPGGCPEPVDLNLLGKDSLEVKLGSFLFFEKEDTLLQDKIKKLFLSLALPTMEDDPKENLSEVKRLEVIAQAVQVVHFICFHLTQLAQLSKLTNEHVHKCQEMLLFISETAIHFDKFKKKSKAEGLFCECFKVVLSHPFLFQQFNPFAKHNTVSSKMLTGFMINIAKTVSGYPELENDIAPYKDKLLANIKLALSKKKNTKGNPLYMVESFNLKFQEITDLLVLISNLSSSLIVDSNENQKLSQWFYLAAHLFERASNLRHKCASDVSETVTLPSSVVHQVSNCIVDLLPMENLDLTSLVEAFRQYIMSCPQQTSHISDSLFSHLLRTNQCGFAISKLAEWMASCMPAKDLSRALKSALEDKKSLGKRIAVILPTFRVALDESRKVLKKLPLADLYGHMKTTVENSLVSLANHPEWLAQNADVVVLLMKRFMKPGERERLCKALEKKAPTLTKEKLHYLYLVTEVLQKKPPQFLLLLLAWLGVALKKYGSSSDKASLIVPLCQTLVKFLREETHDDFSSVRDSKVWQETMRLALKLGLGTGKKDEESAETADTDLSWLLLQTLSILFEKIYSVQEPDHEHLLMVHSMITQHSRFINVIMSSTPSKYELVQTLYVLLERSPKIMESSHAPVLLSAYNATLSKADRAILRILMLYEQQGVDFSHYRPYFWGRQGADYYSIWSHSKSNKSLEQQPKPDEVLGLLNINMVKKTIAKFPIHATLKIKETENHVDGGEVYDPSFCLPLFIYLLSPESPLIAHMFVRSGALAITLCSLSSLDEAVRYAAYTALSRFVSHLQMARGRNKELLLQFMTALQKGMSVFDNQNYRLPSIVSVFLARTSLQISNPQSPLHQTLIHFIIAKSAINVKTVPEFLTLLHSDHIEHVAHRHWMLRVLEEGLRAPIDIALCMDIVVFKLLLSFYSSSLADLESKLRILHCIQSAVSIQYGACCLVKDYSLSPWLHQTIVTMNKEDTTLIHAMLRVLSALWNSLSLPTEGKQDSETGRVMPHVANSASKVCHLLLALHPKLSAPIGIDMLSQYVTVLDDVVANLSPEEMAMFTKVHLVSIIETLAPHCPHKREFFELLDIGCDFINIKQASSSVSPEEKLRIGIRSLTIRWVKHRTLVGKVPLSENIVQ